MNYKSEFNKINEQLSNFNTHPTENLNELYICLVKASFVKCIEFNIFLQDDKEPINSFFYTPFLRGICEDLITLKYLQKHFLNNRDLLLENYIKYLIYSSITAQTSFFNKTVPTQLSPKLENDQKVVEQYEQELKLIMATNGFNKDRLFPSVEHMAIDGKLKHIYDFFLPRHFANGAF